MKIYKVSFYDLINRKFHEYYHKNFQHLEDAKNYAKAAVQECELMFKDNNFHLIEYDYKNDNRLYLADLDHDDYYYYSNKIKRRRIEIVEEQVY